MKGLDIRELVGVPVTKFDLLINTALGLLLGDTFKARLAEYDILISHQQPTNWVAFRSERPYVLLINSLLPILYPDRFGPLSTWDTDLDRIAIDLIVKGGARRVLRWMDQRAVRGAREVMVQGEKLGEVVRDLYGIRPLQVPYGMDFTPYQYTNPASVFSRYSIEPPLLLTVTRALPIKRPDVMIKILPTVLKDHPTATLVIACGKSPFIHIWNNLARRLGVQHRTRIISVLPNEINALYSGAEVLGYPTQALESVGRVVLEGLAFGVPPVVWDNGWGPAEIVRDGVGFRARPYEIDDFADNVLALLNDHEMRRQMGARGKHYVRTNYSWDRAGPPLEQILEQNASSS